MENFNYWFVVHLKPNEKSIALLDLMVTLSDDEIKTNVHSKAKDHHQYLINSFKTAAVII